MKPVNNQIVDEMFPEPEGANFVDIEETSGETNVFIDLQTVHSDFHNSFDDLFDDEEDCG